MSYHIAIDVGSSTVKLQGGTYSNEELSIEEVHRFDTQTRWEDGRHVWDIESLLDGILEGVSHATEQVGEVDSIAIDATAADFGLLSDGALLQNPYFYRDPAVWSTMDELTEHLSERDGFHLTGYNGSPGPLHYQHRQHTELFERADTLVPLPQLLSYELGAEVCAETSYATTLRVFDIDSRTWSTAVFDRLGLPMGVLPPVKPAGTAIGTMDVSTVDNVEHEPTIVLPPSHDTASSVGALPLTDENNAFLCTGSWFIPGLELEEPIVTDDAFDAGASNEIGVEGTVRFLRNLPGFSLLEYCRSRWRDEGRMYEYDEILDGVTDVDPDGPIVDVADGLFMQAQFEGDVETKVQHYCEQTGQPIPAGERSITKCLLASLAGRSALVLETLLSVADQDVDHVSIGGGGVENEPFCQMFASAIDRPVYAGPTEATAVGNLLSQLKTSDHIDDFHEGRQIIEDTYEFEEYTPRNRDSWRVLRSRIQNLVA